MGLLRSERMKHGTVILPTSSARFYVNLVGHGSNIQFLDMNVHDLHRPYKHHVHRIEEMERMLRFLTDELRRLPGVKIVQKRVDEFLANERFTLDSLDDKIREVYEQYVGFRDNNKGLTTELNAALEEKHVMETAWATLAASVVSADAPAGLAEALLPGGVGRMEFGHICGVVGRSEQERFARTVFRASRGNTYTHFSEIVPESGETAEKSVFVIYFQGGNASSLHEKVMKICQTFSVSFYEWPETRSIAQQRTVTLDAIISDKKATLAAFEKYLIDESGQLVCPVSEGGNSLVEEWRLFCLKEKSIYATLNMFTGGEHHLTCRADCWFPADEEAEIKRILSTLPPSGISTSSIVSATLVADDSVENQKMNPPTYFKSTEFNASFQELVDTYGVPRYQEANPALFATVTFPFLFGIMYGDIGHGSLLLAAGLFMMKNADSMRKSESDMVKGFFGARYLITAMGFFAVYAGFMYNDFFSMGLALFTSRYEDPSADNMTGTSYEMLPKSWFNDKNAVDAPGGSHGPYPFGLDPAWVGASNELLFVNSMKMKLSVLFGVTQMLVGVCLKFSNSTYFKNKTDFIFECIPQLMFLLAFFGYMDWMIMYKWVTPVTQDPSLNGPPGIINSMITMALGTPDKTPLYLDQPSYQAMLLKITMISVPLMLIPKPVILYFMNRNKGGNSASAGDYAPLLAEEGGEKAHHHSAAVTAAAPHHGDAHAEEFEIGEVVIHQMIETIEYVLGTVSHTASYLRLWALSLAHQQLSLVFFQKALGPALTSGPLIINGVWIYVAFAVFFGITAGVLLGMDVMECFLHTLRLHWVEFQSKFYKADGYPFSPLSHKDMLESTPAISGSSSSSD